MLISRCSSFRTRWREVVVEDGILSNVRVNRDTKIRHYYVVCEHIRHHLYLQPRREPAPVAHQPPVDRMVLSALRGEHVLDDNNA